MYQMSTSETKGVIENLNTCTRVVNWFRFELFHDYNNNRHIPINLLTCLFVNLSPLF